MIPADAARRLLMGAQGLLEIKGLWWEPGVKATKVRKKALEAAIERLANFIGATEVRISE